MYVVSRLNEILGYNDLVNVIITNQLHIDLELVSLRNFFS